MSLAELVPLILKISVLMIVFALGLSARPADLIYLFRRPSLLVRSVVAMVVAMPLLAVALAKGMALSQPVTVMLVALALAPVPPILPRKQTKAGGDAAYSVGLLAAMGLVSIVWIPLALSLLGRFSALPIEIPVAKVAAAVAMSILAPLAAGTALGLVAPGLSTKLGPVVSKVGGLLLLVALLAVLAGQWEAMGGLVGDGTILAFVIFTVVGLAVGHLLGRPDEDDRTVLAMATATRHPGVALAIAAANFPDAKVLTAAVLLFLVTNAVVSIPYVAWRKRVGAATDLAIA